MFVYINQCFYDANLSIKRNFVCVNDSGGALSVQAAHQKGPFNLILMDGLASCSSSDAEGNR